MESSPASAAATDAAPAHADQPVARITRDGVEYTLLGTAHVSRASVAAVRSLIEAGDFDMGFELVESDWKLKFPQADPQTEIVLVQSTTRSADDPAFRATVADVERAVSANPAIKNLRSPYQPDHADLISKDRHTALVEFDMKGEKKAAEKRIDAIVAATEGVAKQHPGFYVGEAGSISSGKALDKLFKD